MDNQDVAYFQELPAEECRSLLGDADYGRVAWQSARGLLVVPVNHKVVDGHVVFHTFPGTALSELLEPTDVAFQIDDVDEDSAIGWSVLVRGRTAPAPEGIEPVSWLNRGEPIGIWIQEESLSGRAIAGTRRD